MVIPALLLSSIISQSIFQLVLLSSLVIYLLLLPALVSVPRSIVIVTDILQPTVAGVLLSSVSHHLYRLDWGSIPTCQHVVLTIFCTKRASYRSLWIDRILAKDLTVINEAIRSKKEISCLEALSASTVGNLGIKPVIVMQGKVGILQILYGYRMLTLFPDQGWVNPYNPEAHKAELLPWRR